MAKLTINQILQHAVDAHKAGQVQEAHRMYAAILKVQPKHPDANHNTGLLTVGYGKIELALPFFKIALEANPSNAQFWYSHIVALIKLKRLIDAKVLLDQAKSKGIRGADFDQLEQKLNEANKALSIKPNNANAYNNMGIALQDQGKLEEAIEAYNMALAIKPDYAEAYNNKGIALQGQNKLEEAIEAYDRALVVNPDYAEAYYNKGIAFQGQNKQDEAIEAYKKVLEIKPDYINAHRNLSFALLSTGRLKQGLEEYEWRWKTTKGITMMRQFSKPMWDGKETLRGKKILLWCEQGVGDTINWSSRLSLIGSQADHCILECQEKLVPLLTRSFPNFEIKAENRRQDLQRDDFDFHLPMGSLCKYFVSEISEKINPDAFLVPDPVRIRFWQKRLGSLGNGPFIGVSWKSANMSPKRMPNYAPISDWYPIFTIPGVTFINLQYIDFLDDITKIKNEFGVTVHNFDDLDHYNDLGDVSALCAALDMVVSTKITVPLISAGVGTITKLANWRQSPWNNILFNPDGPFVDIFEKNTFEPWHEVFSAIAESITSKMDNSNKLSRSSSNG